MTMFIKNTFLTFEQPSSCVTNRRASSLPPSFEVIAERPCIKLADLFSDSRSSSKASSDECWGSDSCSQTRNHEFGIILNKMGGLPLGLDIDRSDGVTLLIQGVHAGGLIGHWHSKNPTDAVKIGDRIYEVNGVQNNALQLIQQLKESQILDIKIRRPVSGRIACRKTMHYASDASTTASAECSENDTCSRNGESEDSDSARLLVDNLPGKLTGKPDEVSINCEFGIVLHKTYGVPIGLDIDYADGVSLLIEGVHAGGLVDRWHKQVKAGDRIVEVNGVQNNAQLMIKRLTELQILDMKIRRGGHEASSIETPSVSLTHDSKSRSMKKAKSVSSTGGTSLKAHAPVFPPGNFRLNLAPFTLAAPTHERLTVQYQ